MNTPQPAAYRQTRYVAAPALNPPVALSLPELTSDIEQAKLDLVEYGLCLLMDVLSATELEALRTKLGRQAAAERALGELAPPNASATKHLVCHRAANPPKRAIGLESQANFELGTCFIENLLQARDPPILLLPHPG